MSCVRGQLGRIAKHVVTGIFADPRCLDDDLVETIQQSVVGAFAKTEALEGALCERLVAYTHPHFEALYKRHPGLKQSHFREASTTSQGQQQLAHAARELLFIECVATALVHGVDPERAQAQACALLKTGLIPPLGLPPTGTTQILKNMEVSEDLVRAVQAKHRNLQLINTLNAHAAFLPYLSPDFLTAVVSCVDYEHLPRLFAVLPRDPTLIEHALTPMLKSASTSQYFHARLQYLFDAVGVSALTDAQIDRCLDAVLRYEHLPAEHVRALQPRLTDAHIQRQLDRIIADHDDPRLLAPLAPFFADSHITTILDNLDTFQDGVVDMLKDVSDHHVSVLFEGIIHRMERNRAFRPSFGMAAMSRLNPHQKTSLANTLGALIAKSGEPLPSGILDLVRYLPDADYARVIEGVVNARLSSDAHDERLRLLVNIASRLSGNLLDRCFSVVCDTLLSPTNEPLVLHFFYLVYPRLASSQRAKVFELLGEIDGMNDPSHVITMILAESSPTELDDFLQFVLESESQLLRASTKNVVKRNGLAMGTERQQGWVKRM